MSLNINTSYHAKSVSYGSSRSLSSIKYIVIHYTGNSGDTALNNAKYFNSSNTRTAGAHYFIDQSGACYQSIKPTLTAWAVGGVYSTSNGAGSYYKTATNANSVSVELCDLVSKSPSSAMKKTTKQLVAYIQKKCPNAKTIIRHWDVNGKTCPATMTGTSNSTWTAFKNYISSDALTVNGTLNKATVKRLQEWLGVTADGVISDQNIKYQPLYKSYGSKAVEFVSNPDGGSATIKALKKKIGFSNTSGQLGEAGIKALQKYLGCSQTGKLNKATIRALQKKLNSL